MRSATVARVIAAIVGAVAVAGSLSVGSGASTPPGKPVSPPAIYTAAIRYALGAKSFHEDETVSSKNNVWSVTLESEAKAGVLDLQIADRVAKGQSDASSFGFIERLLDDHTYLNGDQRSLSTIVGLTEFNAGFDAGKWLVIPRTASDFAALTYGIEVPTAVAALSLATPITVGRETSFDGKPAIPLISSTGLHASQSNGLQHGSFTLYVSPGKDPVPLGETQKVLISSVRETLAIRLSGWNVKVKITKPASTRPLPS